MFRVLLLFVYFTKLTCQGTLPFVNDELLQITSKIKRALPSKSCLLPNHPDNGEIKILGEEDPYLPGSSVIPNTIIDLSCTNGTVTEAAGGIFRAICDRGEWKPTVSQIRCVRRCPRVQTENESFFSSCTHKNPEINCNNPIEGTIIQLACKPFYQSVGRSIITCRNGTWDSEISPCKPECGKKRVVTAGGSKYPWVVGIYELAKGSQFRGSGSIISRQTVLSAANIFSKENGDRLDKNNYIVTAGKYYRTFGDQRDVNNMQSSRIKVLNIVGVSIYHTGDIAVLTLEDPFIFTEYVQPVCIHWTHQNEHVDLSEGNEGVVAGWGYIQTDNDSEELQALNVPYKSKDTCAMPQNLKNSYYIYDKICAGHDDNNKSTCTGEAGSLAYFQNLPGYCGSGFFFQNSDSRFYIRGILTVMSMKNWVCGPSYPALYTKISPYLIQFKRLLN